MTPDPPKGKLSRLARASKTALKMAGQQVSHVATQPLRSKTDKDQAQKVHEAELGETLFQGLAMMKGTALKAAQLVSMELDLLPEGMREKLLKSCHQVPPMNRAMARKALESALGEQPENFFKTWQSTSLGAASLGQVHQATGLHNEELVVKIQYPGIKDTIHQDVDLLRLFLSNTPLPSLRKKQDLLAVFLSEIEARFIEETDYEKEARELEWFRLKNPFKEIVIPQVYHPGSAQKALSMTHLKGLHLHDFLATNPSQESKNRYAQSLWDFFAHFFIQHTIFHADPNPGNFLFLDDGRLGIIDFGCIKRVDQSFPSELTAAIKAHANQDINYLMNLYNQWGILPDNLKDNPDQVAHHLRAFREWIVKPFSEDTFDFKKHPNHMAERYTAPFQEALHMLSSTTHNFVLFDRTFNGLLSVFSQLEAKLSISFDSHLRI